MAVSQTSTTLTLRRIDGVTQIIRRSYLVVLASTGMSMVTEGLDHSLTPQEMAYLIANLSNTAKTRLARQALRTARDSNTDSGIASPK